MPRVQAALLGFLLLPLYACAPSTGVLQQDPSDPPQKLSEWRLLTKGAESLRLAEGSFAYELEMPLFTDYAQKLRTVWMPEGTRASYRGDEVFEFPLGAIITKTFFFPVADGYLNANWDHAFDENLRALDTSNLRLIETRLLVHSASGWVAVPYLWNEAQTEAHLAITGALETLAILTPEGAIEQADYLVPSRNQCASCHARRNSGGIHPIGPKAWNLDVERWLRRGYLETALPISHHRLVSGARRYLDVNCAHCHSEEGAGDTSGLFLEMTETEPVRLGVCKPPIAAGQGTGGHAHSIEPGAPEESILVFRMRTRDPAEMMPELGRSLVHEAGVSLVEDWISAMRGSCR